MRGSIGIDVSRMLGPRIICPPDAWSWDQMYPVRKGCSPTSFEVVERGSSDYMITFTARELSVDTQPVRLRTSTALFSASVYSF